MNMQFTNHTELIQYVTRCSWKMKIAFFSQISQEITEDRMHISPKILSLCWAELLNQTSINILLKAIDCLQLFTKMYSLHSLRVQKEIIHKLLELTKMRRRQIDENISDIICSLIIKEKEANSHGQRQPQSLCLECFSSSRPTFLFGASEDEAMEEEDTQPQSLEYHFDPRNSSLLEVLLEALKGCRKEVMSLIVNIASRLTKEGILNENELRQLSSGIESVKEVIVNRRCVLMPEKNEIESSISEVLSQLNPIH